MPDRIKSRSERLQQVRSYNSPSTPITSSPTIDLAPDVIAMEKAAVMKQHVDTVNRTLQEAGITDNDVQKEVKDSALKNFFKGLFMGSLDPNTGEKKYADKSVEEIKDDMSETYLKNKAQKAALENPYILNRTTGKKETMEENLPYMEDDNWVNKLKYTIGMEEDLLGNKKFGMNVNPHHNFGDKSKNGQWFFYLDKDEEGKDILAKAQFKDHEDIKRKGKTILNQYGVTPYNTGFWREFGVGIVNTPSNMVDNLVSFTSAAATLGNAAYKAANPFTVGSTTDNAMKAIYKVEDQVRLSNELSESAPGDGSTMGWLGAGVGQGVSSLIQMGILGRAAGKLDSFNKFQHLTNFGAGAVLNFQEFYDSAKEAGLSHERAAAIAMMGGAVNGVIESAIGTNKLVNWLSGGGRKAMVGTVLRELGEDVSDKALDKFFTSFRKQFTGKISDFFEKPVLGTAAEEGIEEFLQTFSQKGIENMYDIMFAGDQKRGEGKYDTKFFSKDSFKESMEAAFFGALVGGGMGGVKILGEKVSGKKSFGDDANILPYIVDGKSDQVHALVTEMHNKGMISDEQKRVYGEHIDHLTSIVDKNSDVFKSYEQYAPEVQEKLKSKAVGLISSMLDDQNKITNLQKKLAEVNADTEMDETAKRDRIESIQKDISNLQFNRQFKDQLIREDYHADVNGKVAAAENNYLNDDEILQNRFSRASKAKQVESLDNSIAKFKTEIANYEALLANPSESDPRTPQELNRLKGIAMTYSTVLEGQKKNILKELEDLKAQHTTITSEEYQKKLAEAAKDPEPVEAPTVTTPVQLEVEENLHNTNVQEETANSPEGQVQSLQQEFDQNAAVILNPNPDMDEEALEALRERQTQILTELDELEKNSISGNSDLVNAMSQLSTRVDATSQLDLDDKIQALELIRQDIIDLGTDMKKKNVDLTELKVMLKALNKQVLELKTNQENIRLQQEAEKKKEQEEAKNNVNNGNVFDNDNFMSTMYRVPAMDKDATAYTKSEADAILMNTPTEDLLADMHFEAVPITAYGLTAHDKSSGTKNKATTLVHPEMNMIIWYNGKKLGILPSSDRFAINGTVINWETITEAEFKATLSTTADFERTKALALNLQKLKAIALTLYKDNGTAVFDATLLEALGIKLAFSSAGVEVAKVEDRVTIDQIPGAKLAALNGGYYIYDQNTGQAIGNPTVEMIHEEGVPAPSTKIAERYLVLTQLGNGQYNWITVQPAQLTGEELKNIASTIRTSIAEIEANPTKRKLLTDLNQQLNDLFFLAGGEGQNHELVMTKPQNGKSKLLLKTKQGVKGKPVTVELNANGKSFKEMFGDHIKQANFRKPLSKIPTEAEALSVFKANATTSIVSKPQLRITFDSDAMDTYMGSTTAPVITPAPVVTPTTVVTDTSVLDSIPEFAIFPPGLKAEIMTELTPSDLALATGNRIEKTQFKQIVNAILAKKNLNNNPLFSTGVSAEGRIKLEQAKEWLKKTLPSFIKSEDIDQLLTNFHNSGETWGAFQDNIIYLSNQAAVGTEYHEAFHAVFRLFMTDKEVAQLYKIAKDKFGTPTQSTLDKFRQQSSTYASLTKQELLDRWYEEKMADDFKAYQLTRDNQSRFRRFWSKLTDWLRAITNRMDDLEAVFYNINRGSFSNASVQRNSFTSETVFSIFYKGKNQEGQSVYSSQRESQVLTTTIAGIAEKRLRNGGTFAQVLDEVIEDQKNLYSLTANKYYAEYTANMNDAEYDEFEKKLLAKAVIFEDPANIELIKKDVKTYFDIFTVEDLDAEESLEDMVNDYGERFEVDPWSIGGLTSLSKAIRQYIGFATYLTKNEFGQEVEVAVDGFTVYNGLIRTLAGLEEHEMLERFKIFSDFNPEAKAVFDKLVADSNIDVTKMDVLPADNNLRKFVNSFKKESINWYTVLYDTRNKKTNVIESNRRSSKQLQVDNWTNRFYDNAIKVKAKDAETVKRILRASAVVNTLSNSKENLSLAQINASATTIRQNLRELGIELSQGYVVYSIIKKQKEQLGISLPIETKRIYDSFNQVVGLYDDNGATLTYFNTDIKDGFSPYEAILDAANKERGLLTRLGNIAAANAIFDESVLNTSFQNADGKTVYSILAPSYALVKLRRITRQSFREELKHDEFISPDGEVLNHLLNSPNSDAFLSQLGQAMFDGFREANLTEEGEVVKESEGLTFGKFDGKTYLLSDIATFISNRKKIRGERGNTVETTALYNINQMEASNTAYLVNLPVYDFFSENGVSDEAAEILFNYLKQEYVRINREWNNKGQVPVYKGYNSDNDGRAYKLAEFRDYSFAQKLEEMAKLSKGDALAGLEFEKENIIRNIKEKMSDDIDEMMKLYDEYGVVLDPAKSPLRNSSDLPINTIKALGNQNYFKGDKLQVREFIGDMYMNQYINTLGINNILMGDYAKGLKTEKNNVDWFKRMKGMIASGPDMGTGQTRVAVYKEPKEYVDNDLNRTDDSNENEIKIADAQSYVTLDHKILQLQRWGRYTPLVAHVYNKIKNGRDITWEDYETLAKNGAALNSTKTVSFDGISYHKLSEIALTPRLVGKADESGNVPMTEINGVAFPAEPKEGFEFLYNKYKAMITQGVDQVMPESASKTATLNPAAFNDKGNFDFTKSIVTVDNQFKRLQVETPTGKTKITQGTQLIQLIHSELNDELPVEFPINPEISNLGQLRDYYRQMLADTRLESFKESLTYVLDGETNEVKVDKLAEKFYKNILESGATDNQIKFFQPENGKRQFNWNLGPIVSKAEQLFLAHFSKGVLSQKVPGLKVSLMSGLGIKIRDQKTGVMRELAHMAQDEDGNYYSECLLPPFAKELLGTNPSDEKVRDVLKMFGIRIPTQDKHSMMSLKVVGFLPVEYGSIGVFPKEVVYLSGADFDIDSEFIHRLDYFKKKGKLVPYGTATTDAEKYEEWKTYILEHNSEVRRYLRESSVLSGHPVLQEQANQLKEDLDNAYSRETYFQIISILKEEKPFLIEQAFEEAGLPTTIDQFVATKPLNPGVANNAMVYAQIKFLTNEYVREGQSEIDAAGKMIHKGGAAKVPATMDKIHAVARFVQNAINKDAYQSSPNTPFERFKANRSNSEGKTGIGPVALSNVTNSFLSSYKVELTHRAWHPYVNGQELNGFGEVLDTNGERKNDNLSTLLSAMTDNAKEQLADKLNLTMDMLSPVSYMMSLGMSLEDSMLLINQPAVRIATKAKVANQEDFLDLKTEIEMLDGMVSTIMAKMPEEERPDLSELTDALTTEKLKENIELFGRIVTHKDLANLPLKVIYNQYVLLSRVNSMVEQSRYNNKVSALMSLNKGLEATFEDNLKFKDAIDKLQLAPFFPYTDAYSYAEAIQDLIRRNIIRPNPDKSSPLKYIKGAMYPNLYVPKGSEDKIPYDARLAIVNDPNTFQNLLIYDKVINDVARQFFISQTRLFRNIHQGMTTSDSSASQKYLFSYLSSRAYEKYLEVSSEEKFNEFKSLVGQYGHILSGTPNSIEDQLNTLKKNKELFANNKLLRMLKLNKPLKNSKVVNITFPTRIKDPDLLSALAEDYNSLFMNPETKEFAINLFYYAYFKDGLQFKNNSVINVIGNYMFRRLSKSLDLLNENLNKASIDDTFRQAPVVIVKDVLDSFYSDINNKNVPKISDMIAKKEKDTVRISIFNKPGQNPAGLEDALTQEVIDNMNSIMGFIKQADTKTPQFFFPYSFNRMGYMPQTGTYIEARYEISKLRQVNGDSVTEITPDEYIEEIIRTGGANNFGYEVEYIKSPAQQTGDPAITGGGFSYAAKKNIKDGTALKKTAPVATVVTNTREYTPEKITKLQPNEVFVFGSNTQGRHGKGAALDAKTNFGAIQGQAEGLQGQSYAVITKDLTVPIDKQAKGVSLERIGKGLQNMLLFAKQNPGKKFYVTTLGSSLAGYDVSEIKGVFKKLEKLIPDNVILPQVYEVRPDTIQSVNSTVNIEGIDFQEEPTTGYTNRTRKNASADATIALAVDFTSAGEKLTKTSVLSQGKKYIPVDAKSLTVTEDRVNKIVGYLNAVNAKTLNIAGNGIYTMKGQYTQEQVDNFTYDLLNAVLNSPLLKNKIQSIRTGGQTGFDEAGTKAAVRLGIPSLILAPKGWKFRDINGTDITDEQAFKARFANIDVNSNDNNLQNPVQLSIFADPSASVQDTQDMELFNSLKSGEALPTDSYNLDEFPEPPSETVKVPKSMDQFPPNESGTTDATGQPPCK